MNRAERRRAQRAGKSTDPLAITWYSNAMWAPTGYGTQTAQAVRRLAADGHEVAVATNYGLAAMRTVFEGIPHYPEGVLPGSNDTIGMTFRDWSAQHPDRTPICLALYDAWPLVGAGWDRMPVGIWTMVDSFPCPPKVLAFLAKPNVLPIGASRYAQREIQRAGVEALYVPMAVDTNLYKPTPTWKRPDGSDVTGRQLMGFDEDCFVVSMVNANKAGSPLHRKAWGENLMAFSIFAEGKDDVRAYVHTEKLGLYSGFNLVEYAAALEIPEGKLRFVDQWAYHNSIPNDAMAAIYTASDVLLAATMGEGFGLTVLEAAACETPAIVSDFTCQPELVTDDSYIVGGQPFWNSAQNAFWQVPNVGEIVDALEAAYARGRFRSTAQRQLALGYDADQVFAEHWRPALVRLTEHAREHAPSGRTKPTPTPVPADGPLLTIYVPTYKRPTELKRLLESLNGQMAPRVEVVVADDDPEQSGAMVCAPHPWVRYVSRGVNLGGDENLQRGYEESAGVFVWMVGDDDWLLPGAVEAVLKAIRDGDADRLILLSPAAPRTAAGVVGTPAQVEAASPGINVASTLITANVVRRSALDLVAGRVEVDSMYGWAFSFAGVRRCRVLFDPAFEVGTEHAGAYVESRGKSTGEAIDTWRRLLFAMGVPWSDSVVAWNHVQAARRAA